MGLCYTEAAGEARGQAAQLPHLWSQRALEGLVPAQDWTATDAVTPVRLGPRWPAREKVAGGQRRDDRPGLQQSVVPFNFSLSLRSFNLLCFKGMQFPTLVSSGLWDLWMCCFRLRPVSARWSATQVQLERTGTCFGGAWCWLISLVHDVCHSTWKDQLMRLNTCWKISISFEFLGTFWTSVRKSDENVWRKSELIQYQCL